MQSRSRTHSKIRAMARRREREEKVMRRVRNRLKWFAMSSDWWSMRKKKRKRKKRICFIGEGLGADLSSGPARRVGTRLLRSRVGTSGDAVGNFKVQSSKE